MRRHAAWQLGMVLKGSISTAVSAINSDELAPRTVFVTNQWMVGQVWLMRIMGQIYRHQTHATIIPPAPGGLGCQARQCCFELQPILTPHAILHGNDMPFCATL